MRSSQRILPDDFLAPVFRMRLYAYLSGFGIVAILSVADPSLVALVPTVGIGLVAAVIQTRTLSAFTAYYFDLTLAVALALIVESPLALVMIVGWAAAIGLSDVRHQKIVPVAAGVAAAISTLLLEMHGTALAFLKPIDWAAVGLVAGAAVLFEIIFRSVGDLLRAHEAELRSFFKRVPIALVRTDESGRLKQANLAAADMFGTEAASYSPASFLDPDTRTRLLERLATDGTVTDFEAVVHIGATRSFPALIAAHAVTNLDGSLKFIEAGLLDLSALHEAQRGRERLARVVESTSDMIALAERDGRIVFTNPAATTWWRSHFTAPPARSLDELIPESEIHEILADFEHRGEWTGEVDVTAGAEAARTLRLSLYRLEGEESIAIIAHDATDEIATAQKLAKLVAAKDEFVAAVSHEIRTPLTAVVGLAAELNDHADLFDRGTRNEMMELIVEQSREVADIVEDLLVAARIDTDSVVIAREVVDLQRVTRNLLDSLPRSDTSTRSIVSDMCGTCIGDPRRIRQILRNLLTNALRYGGPDIRLESRSEGDHVLMSVSDDGPGVDPARAERIFEPFERAHTIGTQPSSVGLGLSVSRELARRMDGDVTYARVEDRSVFTLRVPAPNDR